MSDVFWKAIVTVGILVGIASGATAVSKHIASNKDLENLEVRVVTTLETFQGKIQLQFDLILLERINQEMTAYRRLMRENPDDYVLVEEYEKLRESKQLLQKRIKERLK